MRTPPRGTGFPAELPILDQRWAQSPFHRPDRLNTPGTWTYLAHVGRRGPSRPPTPEGVVQPLRECAEISGAGKGSTRADQAGESFPPKGRRRPAEHALGSPPRPPAARPTCATPPPPTVTCATPPPHSHMRRPPPPPTVPHSHRTTPQPRGTPPQNTTKCVQPEAPTPPSMVHPPTPAPPPQRVLRYDPLSARCEDGAGQGRRAFHNGRGPVQSVGFLGPVAQAPA